MSDRVTVVGVERLTATLAAAAVRVVDMSEPMRATGTLVSTRARADAPVITGRLAASVRASTDSEAAAIGSGLEYANRVHWGYARFGQRAQPFIYDAVRTNEATIVGFHAKRVDDVVGAVKGI
jgi:phage gpG-like protein